jgi:hypothetical protein
LGNSPPPLTDFSPRFTRHLFGRAKIGNPTSQCPQRFQRSKRSKRKKRKKRNKPNKLAVDGSLIQKELGFVPEYDLKTGWQETIKEMRRSGDL